MFEIVILDKSGKAQQTIGCVNESCKVGSSRDCLVRLKGWRVPAEALELQLTANGLQAVPIAGVEPALLNDEPLQTSNLLKPDDRLKVSNTALVVNVLPEGLAQIETIKQEFNSANANPYMVWVRRVHDELLRQMDLQRVDVSGLHDEALRVEVQNILQQIVDSLGAQIPDHIEPQKLLTDVLNEAVGLGPLETLLAQDDITEIMVNRYDDIYIERAGKLEASDVVFTNDTAVRSAIERIVSPLGRRIDESSPLVDARLKDGSRVNAVIPPLALRGSCITIRKFSDKKLTAEDLIGFGAASGKMMKFLQFAVEQRMNVVISGGTGSGKTTLLNVLSNFIPFGERVVTVEDAAELRLVQPHLISLEARPANIEGKGQVTIRDLVKNCLRMRPDRIVVGECRGGEALDMLQAMNTGHDGSLTTAHANAPSDLLSRLEVMVLMAGMELPVSAIREQVGSAVDLVVQQTRYADGSRRIASVCEVLGVEDGQVKLAELMRFNQQGFDEEGRVQGHFESTGVRPELVQIMSERGVVFDAGLFEQGAHSE